VKLKPFDAKIAYAQRMFEIDKMNDALEFELRQIAKERARNLIGDDEFNRRLETIRSKKQRIIQKARALSGAANDE